MFLRGIPKHQLDFLNTLAPIHTITELGGTDTFDITKEARSFADLNSATVLACYNQKPLSSNSTNLGERVHFRRQHKLVIPGQDNRK